MKYLGMALVGFAALAVASTANAVTLKQRPFMTMAPVEAGTCVSRAGCERACAQGQPNRVQACILNRCTGCTKP